MADEAARKDAIARLSQAIVDLVGSDPETLADDIWLACADAGSQLRRAKPGAPPVARTNANLEPLGRLDRASRRFGPFSQFLLAPVETPREPL